ncbi:MAG: hypothetical protein DWQ37_22815 [Planctomycetota bacterium]|nr:MAG: hypothetical protein DWQ37_22815 [Planctomycetota bacterium]
MTEMVAGEDRAGADDVQSADDGALRTIAHNHVEHSACIWPAGMRVGQSLRSLLSIRISMTWPGVSGSNS